MKRRVSHLLPVLACVLVLNPFGRPADRQVSQIPGPALLEAAVRGIPDHPDELDYPDLVYEPPRAADHRRELKNGVPCYIVEDHAVPLVEVTVNIVADFRQVPAELWGLHGITMELLCSSGSAVHDAARIEEEIAFLGAELRSGSSTSGGYARIELLSKDLETGLDLLFEQLREPAFQQDRLDLLVEERLASMRRRNDHPRSIERMALPRLAYDPAYWLPTTEATLRALTRERLLEWHDRWVRPDNLLITVAGDVDEDLAARELELRMKGWKKGGATPGDRQPLYKDVSPGVYLVHKEVNQARVRAILPGLRRDDPHWQAAYLMNEILGGSGMSCRLMQRIRTQAGLAYHASSRLEENHFGQGLFQGMFQTKVESTQQAMSLLAEEYRRIVEDLSREELEAARNQMIEAFPTWFASASDKCRLFAREELSGRFESDPDYYANLRDVVRRLTLDDLKQAARDLLKTGEIVWLIVGDAQVIRSPDTEHGLKLSDFGPVELLPQRDPMTQEIID